MTSIKDFKNVADNIMSDINVSDELKEKTLDRCMKRRQIFNISNYKIGKLLVPATCFALILGVVKISGILPLKTQIGDEGTPEINITMDTSRATGTPPGQTDNIRPYSNTEQNNNTTWDNGTKSAEIHEIERLEELNTVDEAVQIFGDEFRSPSYIPEGFKLNRIQTSAFENEKSDKIVLSYSAGERSFSVIQEKTEKQIDPVGYKTIDLDGITGYLRTNEEHYDEVSSNKLDVISESKSVNGSYSGETNISKAFTGETGASGGGETGNDASVSNITDIANVISPYTELFWFSNEIRYSVIGQISESEAVEIAKSMK